MPCGATSGPISVTTSGGSATSSTGFTVTAPPTAVPTVSGFTPASGPVGTTVTINGANFTGATTVKFSTTAATTWSVVSDQQITARVPSGARNGPISVTTSAGTGTSSASFRVSKR